MSVFREAELRYLAGGRQLGRIATVGADGTPHVVPVGWIYNAARETIDIGGHELERTKKFRDVARTGRAAIVIDDLASTDPWHPRGVEVRGRGEAIALPTPLIRIHPERIVSWGLERGRSARTVAPHPRASLEVVDRGRLLSFTIEDLMRYHGPGSPGGVAIAFKALERGLPLLAGGAPPARREIAVRTAFGGPGARDAFELVTRAVADGRYVVDLRLARPERGRVLERFVFELVHRETRATLLLEDGFVDDEFIDLARAPQRSAAQEARLDLLKRDLAARVMAAPAADVFEAET
jgi:pyridoxamine 5'-phosphate oxidase family protein